MGDREGKFPEFGVGTLIQISSDFQKKTFIIKNTPFQAKNSFFSGEGRSPPHRPLLRGTPLIAPNQAFWTSSVFSEFQPNLRRCSYRKRSDCITRTKSVLQKMVCKRSRLFGGRMQYNQ